MDSDMATATVMAAYTEALDGITPIPGIIPIIIRIGIPLTIITVTEEDVIAVIQIGPPMAGTAGIITDTEPTFSHMMEFMASGQVHCLPVKMNKAERPALILQE